MAISLASATGNTATSSPVTVNKPTGKWATGNYMLAGVASDLTPPDLPDLITGWTGIDSDAVDSESRDMGRIGSSEPSSYGFTGGNAGDLLTSGAVSVLEYSGVDTSSATPHKHSVKVGNSKTASFTGITPTINGCQIIAVVMAAIKASGATFSVPTGGFSLQESRAASSTQTFFAYTNMWDLNQGTAALITPGNVTITTSATAANTFWGAYLIALAPAAAATTVFRRTLSPVGTRSGSRQTFAVRKGLLVPVFGVAV